MLNTLENIKENTKTYKEKCIELKNKKNISIFLKILKVLVVSILAVIYFIVKVIIALFSIMFRANRGKKHSYNKTFNFKTKEKKKSYSLYDELEPWQQELVDKGEFDETSFDEEEPYEEDDYYSENI